MMHTCPLCLHSTTILFASDKTREYRQCRFCRLVFVPQTYHITREKEKAAYDLHENSPLDPRYRRFLNQLYEPMIERIQDSGHGLDFGCGPGPTLSVMFEEAGHKMQIYDPFYANNPEALEHNYDFITLSEVIEHLREPRKELDKLWDCLKINGWLGILTQMVTNRKAFQAWHYKNDPTHIGFYSPQTFKLIARLWSAPVYLQNKNVVLFHKKDKSGQKHAAR
ncbi:class I SAM-dependent methyltransferase [candidate division KSB1 bacterium]|nr:class I SAM-dependent methyltransferase [candidate division KSB1 bacterium]